jgi:glutamine amidotransferase-like uncharacterized protein
MRNKRIGLYISDGVSSSTINVWLTHYKNGLIKNLSVLKADDFVLEKLKDYDLIILPGGSGSKICNTLGEHNRNELKKYVEQGGNLLGVCAGAYAISSGYDWSMSLINYELVDKKNAHRGEAVMPFELTKAGMKLLRIKDGNLPSIYYHNGPVWKIFDSEKENTSTVLATFKEDIYAEAGTAGQASGTPAIIYDKFGIGKVMAISPHFEKSLGYEYVIDKVIRFLTNGKK